MNEIFEYTDFRAFLRDFFAQRKNESSYFSYRNISRKIGIRSSGYLSWIISGKRNLSLKLAPTLAKAIRLSRKESTYFVQMVRYTQSKTLDQKQEAFEKLTALRDPDPTSLGREHYEFYRKWFYTAVREVIGQGGVTNDYETLASRLQPQISPSQAQESLSLLLRLDLIEKAPDGTYRQRDSLLTSGREIPSMAIHAFQAATMDLARESLVTIPKQERDISTVSMNIDEQTLTIIKQKASEFRREIMTLASSCTAPTRAFQFNMQFFPISKHKDQDT